MLFSVLLATTAFALDNGIGRLPALGWNSWNAYACEINESIFLDAANAFVSQGYQAAGYQYINIDDCWSVRSGRNSTNKEIMPDLDKFPDGISGLASRLHDMKLKLGIYSSAGKTTCAGYPASIGYESVDAATFARWGVDYLKYDNCDVPGNWSDSCESCNPESENLVNGTCQGESFHSGLCASGYNYANSSTAHRYQIMRDALLAQNRSILYSLCEWGTQNVWEWGNATANSWRTTGDIFPAWGRLVNIINQNTFYTNFAGFSGHNDWDMLEIGNEDLTEAEARSHFALWALGKSPLLISANLNEISEAERKILLNKHLLAFNQDPVYGLSAAPFRWGQNKDWTFNTTSPAEYWSGRSSSGVFVAMFNSLDTSQNMTATWDEIPGLDKASYYGAINAWTDEEVHISGRSISAEVAAHDTAVFVIQPHHNYQGPESGGMEIPLVA